MTSPTPGFHHSHLNMEPISRSASVPSSLSKSDSLINVLVKALVKKIPWTLLEDRLEVKESQMINHSSVHMPISLRFYNTPRNSLSCTFTWCEPSWSPHFRQPISLALRVTLGCLGKHIRYKLWCTHPYWGILTNVFFIFPTW